MSTHIHFLGVKMLQKPAVLIQLGVAHSSRVWFVERKSDEIHRSCKSILQVWDDAGFVFTV